MPEYKLKPGKIGKAIIDAYKKVEEKFKDIFLEKDETQESGYTIKTGKTADVLSGAYKKVEDKFVNAFLEEVEDNTNKSKK